MKNEAEREEFVFYRKIRKKIIWTIDNYGLINTGDNVLLGLSGGKDSLVLLEELGSKNLRFRFGFRLYAAYISTENIPYKADIEYLQSLCKNLDVEFIHRSTRFDPSTDKRKSPCFLCSWNRRKTLFSIAREFNCKSLALGHHLDDLVETMLMNVTFQGAFCTMPPKLKMDNWDFSIIRPLAIIPEEDIIRYASYNNYKIIEKNCPYEEHSYRSDIKKMIKDLEKLNPNVRQSMYAAMENMKLDYLPKKVL